MKRIELEGRDVVGIRADNPGPLTLSGTNSWIVGRDPAWVIDPGPALDAHVAALVMELQSRGGLAGVALTHDHHDHTEAVPAIFPSERARARRMVSVPAQAPGRASSQSTSVRGHSVCQKAISS